MYAMKLAHRKSVLEELRKYFTEVKISTSNDSQTKYQTDGQNTMHLKKLEMDPARRGKHFLLQNMTLTRTTAPYLRVSRELPPPVFST